MLICALRMVAKRVKISFDKNPVNGLQASSFRLKNQQKMSAKAKATTRSLALMKSVPVKVPQGSLLGAPEAKFKLIETTQESRLQLARRLVNLVCLSDKAHNGLPAKS